MRVAATILITGLMLCLAPAANAQFKIQQSNQSGGGFGGGVPFGGAVAPLPNSGPYYYPGFGYSSRPLPGAGYGGLGYGSVYGMPIATPIPVGGAAGYFKFGNAAIQYWKAPSGYYYPWGMGAGYGVPNTTYVIQQGVTQAEKPPLSALFTDMQKYMDDNKDRGRISDADFNHIFRRLQDIRGKYDHDRAAGNGTADASDEEYARRQLELLGSELSMKIKPNAGGASSTPSVKSY